MNLSKYVMVVSYTWDILKFWSLSNVMFELNLELGCDMVTLKVKSEIRWKFRGVTILNLKDLFYLVKYVFSGL